jgi:hypothetical protein
MKTSGKLWIIISDVVFSVAALVSTTLLTPDNTIRLLVVGIIAILQPAIVAIIKLYDIDAAMKNLAYRFQTFSTTAKK